MNGEDKFIYLLKCLAEAAREIKCDYRKDEFYNNTRRQQVLAVHPDQLYKINKVAELKLPDDGTRGRELSSGQGNWIDFDPVSSAMPAFVRKPRTAHQ